jgi:pSer/pThr/pTyr-binding forkhead associated (FHA) protein
VIGRDKSKCSVVFPDQTPGVSGVHCKISFDGKNATITDLQSSYGTFVDGKKLMPNSATQLHRGLVIMLGSKHNLFTLQ